MNFLANISNKKYFLGLGLASLLFLFGGLFCAQAAGLDVTVSSNASWPAGTYNYGDLVVTNNATLTLQGNTSSGTGVIIYADSLTVDSGSIISSDGRGYGSSSGTGQGTDDNNSSYAGAAGAGHGGVGGADYHGYAGGTTYGVAARPVTLGSGGGIGYGSSAGGTGGGAIKIVVTGTATINGTVSSNALNDAGTYGGGGSGGSVWISANIITGGGAVRANGGNGRGYSGGGAGGRVALIYLSQDNFSGSVTATAGTAYINGNAGTVTRSSGGAFPSISSVTPRSASISGGDTVIISGANFTSTPTVTFGGTSATSVTMQDANTLSVVVPAHSAGIVDVIVSNPDGQSAILSSGFSFFSDTPPSAVSINPTQGNPSGGAAVTISGTNFNLSQQAQCDASTVSILRLNETSGAVADSCSANHAVATGTTSVAGKYGNSRSFNGSSDYFSIAHSSNYNFDTNDNFTISYWLKVPSTQNNTGSTSNSIFEKWPVSGGVGNPYPFRCRLYNQNAGGNAGKIFCDRYDGTNMPGVTTSGTVNDNQWHHIAFVKNGSSLLLYVDGQLSNSGTDNTSATTTNTSALYVGAKGGSALYFTGTLDDIRMDNIARTETDVTEAYNSGNFDHETNVTFDGISAADVRFVSSTSITAVTPGHSAGSVDVVVANYDWQSSTLTDGYTYNFQPVISSITPPGATTGGNRTVIISGGDFYGTPTVTFGGISALSVTLIDDSTLSVVVPAHALGTVDVVVTDPLGEIATLEDAFTYTQPEMIHGTIKTIGNVRMNQ